MAGNLNPKKDPSRPSNAKSVVDWNLEQLKKTAQSRGIPLEKLVAQMVEQYLKEEQDPGAGPEKKAP